MQEGWTAFSNYHSATRTKFRKKTDYLDRKKKSVSTRDEAEGGKR